MLLWTILHVNNFADHYLENTLAADCTSCKDIHFNQNHQISPKSFHAKCPLVGTSEGYLEAAFHFPVHYIVHLLFYACFYDSRQLIEAAKAKHLAIVHTDWFRTRIRKQIGSWQIQCNFTLASGKHQRKVWYRFLQYLTVNRPGSFVPIQCQCFGQRHFLTHMGEQNRGTALNPFKTLRKTLTLTLKGNETLMMVSPTHLHRTG